MRKSTRVKKKNSKYIQEPSIKEKKQIKKVQQQKQIQNKIQQQQQQQQQEEQDKIDVIYSKKKLIQKKLETLFIPDGDITTQLNKAVIKLKTVHNNIPSAFIDGMILLEEHPRNFKQPKEVSLTKLKNKQYETDDSKSDANIVSKINSYINKIPSFQKYKSIDDVKYFVINHREIFKDLMEYRADNKHSLATLKNDLTAILRIFRIAYTSKASPLYIKYSTIQDQIGEIIDKKEGDNTLNDNEETRFLMWRDVILHRNKLEDDFNKIKNNPLLKKEAFSANQDSVLVSLTTLTPVLRQEIGTLKFTTTKPTDKNEDYVYIRPTGGVSLELFKDKKKHGYISLPLNFRTEPKPTQLSLEILKNQEHLANLLKESYKLYPREYVFVDKTKYPTKIIGVKSIAPRLNKIFTPYGINIGTSSLRSSYVSYRFAKYQHTLNEKDELAVFMRTSRAQLDRAYNKIFRQDIRDIPLTALSIDENNQVVKVQVKQEEPPPDRQPQITTLVQTSYEKHLERVNNRYRTSKEIIVKRDGVDVKTTEAKVQAMKTYHNRDKTAMARARILRDFKNNPSKKITQKSIDKYGFTEQELKR